MDSKLTATRKQACPARRIEELKTVKTAGASSYSQKWTLYELSHTEKS